MNVGPIERWLTVLVAVKDNPTGLARTLGSILSQDVAACEIVVIDGSRDERTSDSAKCVLRAQGVPWTLLRSDDISVYEAMNFGLRSVETDWILFLNSDDIFASKTTVRALTEARRADSAASVLYSDVIIDSGGKRRIQECDPSTSLINHQCFVYRRSLHIRYGNYVVSRHMLIADYLFMMSLEDEVWRKVADPIAVYDGNGMSNDGFSFYRRICADFILGRVSSATLGVSWILYRPWTRLKSMLNWLT